ncbi:MAG: hypothetical protein WDN26_13055 [Chitinophagaceae bacterium]
MNTAAYIFYLFITYIITVHVGLVFYRNGKFYILKLLHGDERLTDFINRMLLTGYYLLNLGYVALTLSTWKTILTWTEVLVTVLVMTGKIMLTLAVIHFFNMAAIYLYSKKHNNIPHHKTSDI